MCHHHADQPSEDAPLTDELAQLESLLGKRNLPQSRVDRDELLYRAGWAAAEARLGNNSQGNASTQTSLVHMPWRQIGVSSLTSAVLAASLAVAVTIQFVTPKTPDVAVSRESLEEPQPIEVSSEEDIPVVSVEPLVASVSANWPMATNWESTAPLLMLRDRILSGQTDERWITTRRLDSTPLAPTTDRSSPKTSREILTELLPQV